MIKNTIPDPTVFTKLEIADTFKDRMIGLLNRESLSPQSALLLTKCRSVHTFGMRFSIDIAFLDKDGHVLSLVDSRVGFAQLAVDRHHIHWKAVQGECAN